MRSDPRKRYSSTKVFSFSEGAQNVFRGLMPRDVSVKPAYVEHEVQVGERLDNLAEAYYGDARMWWVIAQANPIFFFSADLVYKPLEVDGVIPEVRAGSTIYIPAKPEGPV